MAASSPWHRSAKINKFNKKNTQSGEEKSVGPRRFREAAERRYAPVARQTGRRARDEKKNGAYENDSPRRPEKTTRTRHASLKEPRIPPRYGVVLTRVRGGEGAAINRLKTKAARRCTNNNNNDDTIDATLLHTTHCPWTSII